MQKIRGAAHVMNCLGVVLPSKGKKENEEPADLWAMDAPKESVFTFTVDLMSIRLSICFRDISIFSFLINLSIILLV